MTILLYRLFVQLYKWGAFCLSPFNRKARQWQMGRKNIFNHLQELLKENENKIIWFHCASLGEFEQGRPLLEILKSTYPQYRILLSFFSPSGYEVRKNYEGADFIVYLPMDTASNARQFIKLVNPSLVVWIKYEYWYYYLQTLKENSIPVILVSGIFRKDQPFFKWYGGLYRKMLSFFTAFFVQNTASKQLLESIQLSANVIVGGDTRFDRVIEIANTAKSLPLIEKFIAGAPVVVAGSTWEEDEEMLDHYANTHPQIKFIIAPHEIDEEHIACIRQLFKNSIRYSQLMGDSTRDIQDDANNAGIVPNVLIIDNIGLLAQLYQYGTICFIGGGFGDDGVHNVLEAAVYGKPVVFGPVYEKYAEAIGLVECEGAFTIESALELEELLNELLSNAVTSATAGKASHDYVYANKGATQKILDYIQENRLLTN